MANIRLGIQRQPAKASRRWAVVFFKLSRLLNQEDALSAPYCCPTNLPVVLCACRYSGLLPK
jgi:hypothetical protein